MNNLDPVLKSAKSGYHAILATGNICDYMIDQDRIVFRPYYIAEQLYKSKYIVIRYSRSAGMFIHYYSSIEADRAKDLNSRLHAVGIEHLVNKERESTSDEINQFFRGITRLLMSNSNHEMKFAVLIDYAEHLAPAVNTSAAASDEQTYVAECLHTLAMSPALRKSENVLICFVRDGLQNILLNDFYRVDYLFPTETETESFAKVALDRKTNTGEPTYARLEENLTIEEFGRLTRGLRIRDLENIFREAKAENRNVIRDEILLAKAKSVLNASEGTLEIIQSKITIQDIVGLDVVKKVFEKFAESLKNGDAASPRAVCMVGPPGTAKSNFAPILAQMAGFNLVQFKNVKNMYVGESERRLRLALSLVESLAPTILFIDEITEMTPGRNKYGGDDGVSQDFLGQLFKFSAQEDLRGRVLILAASNVAEQLDFAWHDRFIFIPFLEMLPNDMCKLFPVIERRITGEETLHPNSDYIKKACLILHSKGASPRKFFDIIDHALLFSKDSGLTSSSILRAAEEYNGTVNPMSVGYTTMASIYLTTFVNYFPWYLDPKNYLYPSYLEDIVDKKSGEIDKIVLKKRMEEYKNQVNT